MQIYANQFMTSYYSTFICLFESGKCEKEGKKLQKFEYLQNGKSFFNEIKNIFYSFWRSVIWWKNKNWWNVADTKLLIEKLLTFF